jgi:uncharacterized repeat protein (TIGR03803 family)
LHTSNGWKEETLYSFKGPNGSTPAGGLAISSLGNLYGTTKLGGANGVGVVFELLESSLGAWTYRIIHQFGGGKDGQYPSGNLVFDSAGNLYGTTQGGGAYGNGTETVGGTAFKLTPNSSGTWSETVIHSFGNGTDGAEPRSGATLDDSGNVYGTTYNGGSLGFGAVFEVSPQAHGGWKESVLYSFDIQSGDGFHPVGGVVLDALGNLYGTNIFGGSLGGGTVFELSQSAGMWTESVLWGFQGTTRNASPYSGLVFDSAGNLYGTTAYAPSTGSVFELSPIGGGYWNETNLFTFNTTQGSKPGIGSLAIDSKGNLYGGAQAGGANLDGVIFEVTPK